jgi:long-subunit acyl-CoA synthetase (AMP-forming)
VQTEGLVQAWRWKSSDRILHVLPLHHVHGIINALQCPLYAGATVEILEKFDNNAVWQRWISGKKGDSINVFMAVPTIYCKIQTGCFDRVLPTSLFMTLTLNSLSSQADQALYHRAIRVGSNCCDRCLCGISSYGVWISIITYTCSS